MYDLIVIGAGPGGYEAAAHAAKMGKTVALIEKDRTGGTCLNVGCIPTKTFLKTARLFHETKRAACFGLETGNIRVDMGAVVDRKNRIVGTLTGGVESMLRRAGVEMIHGHASIIARGKVTVDGTALEARNILIATGSRPANPPIPGLSTSPAVRDSSAILDERSVPESIVIVGGGYIGLEFASFFSTVGTRVTLLEMTGEIAGGTDSDVVAKLSQCLEDSGVSIKTNCRVTRIDGERVTYLDSTGSTGTVDAPRILNATGRVPVVNDLGLTAAGVDWSERGIRTSDEGKTNVPGIWACGDVTGRRLLAHAATREGIVAVNNMFGRRDRIRYHAVPSVIYTHPEIASVGWSEKELRERGVEYRRAAVSANTSGRFVVENEGGSGMVKVLAGKRYGEILGVHMAGDGVSEFVVLAAAMIETEMTVSQAADIVFPHPTISECLKNAILELA